MRNRTIGTVSLNVNRLKSMLHHALEPCGFNGEWVARLVDEILTGCTNTHTDKFILDDVYSEVTGGRPRTKGEIVRHDQAILVRFSGYGDCCSRDGYGTPVLIENREGVPHVIVWADINREDPTHTISLEAAKESNRKEE